MYLGDHLRIFMFLIVVSVSLQINCSNSDFFEYTVIDKNCDEKKYNDTIVTIWQKTLSVGVVKERIQNLCNQNFNITEEISDLIIDDCQVKEIETEFFLDIKIINEISIIHNDITTIFRGTFKNLSIKNLILKNNNIIDFEDGGVENLPNLNVLDLSSNGLATLTPQQFINVPNLRIFNIEYNIIAIFEDNVFSFIQSNNAKIFAGFNNLCVLNTQTFNSKNTNLVLNLSHNIIEKLPQFVFENITLDMVDLSYNRHFLLHTLYQCCHNCQIKKLNIKPLGVSHEIIEWAYRNDISLMFEASSNDKKLTLVLLIMSVCFKYLAN